MLVLKNVGVKVEIRYKVNGREITESGEASTPDKILERIWKNPRYPENAQIALYF